MPNVVGVGDQIAVLNQASEHIAVHLAEGSRMSVVTFTEPKRLAKAFMKLR